MFDTTAVAIAVGVAWAVATHQHPVLPRICGAEMGTESAADEPWVCIRAPHPDTEHHQALDGSTWRD